MPHVCADEVNAFIAAVQAVLPFLPRLKVVYYRVRQRFSRKA